MSLVEEAARGGAALIVLPEGTVPGYVLGMRPVAPELLARAFRELAALARRYEATVVYGAAKIVAGKTFNAAIAIGPDGVEAGHASKHFLWHFDRRWYSAGETLEPVPTPLAKLGLLVCADGRIPTIAATLCDRGAELLVMPTAWVASGRDPHALENVQADLMANVRARENGVPFVAANKVGTERASVAYCGKSSLIDASGATLARGSETAEEIVFGVLDVGARARPERRTFGFALSPPHRSGRRERARIAFTLASDPGEIENFALGAAEADVDLLFACSATNGGRATRATDPPQATDMPADMPAVFQSHANDAVANVGDVVVAVVTSQTIRSPRGLVEARLAGIDLFLWHADGEGTWHVPFARTRAAELRAYVIVFDAQGERAFAIDPDGIVVAGTFDGFRVAAFAYDRARTSATTVAPATDVLAGLRNAEATRAHDRLEGAHA